MKIKGICFAVAIMLFFYSFFGIAQTKKDPKDRVPTVEELYLSNTNLLLINQYALSPDKEQKMRGLQEIEKLIKANDIADSAEVLLSVLSHLSQEGTLHEVKEGTTLVNYFPLVRKKAAELLGLLGKTTTKPEIASQAKDTLIDVLKTDIEPMVRSEAVFSLGIIGLNENGDVVRAIDYTLNTISIIQPDNNFAFAVVLAIEKLADANKGIKEWEAYSTLVKIMQGNYNRMVKEKALAVLEKIKKYQEQQK